MERIAVASSNIESIGYDEDGQILEVEFKSSDVYQYFGVPKAAYLQVISAGSVGGTFHRVIKNSFEYLKIS